MLGSNAVGNDVEDEGEDEEHDAYGKQGVVVIRAKGRFGHFRCDGGGHGPDGRKEGVGDDACAACAHENDHGFANGSGHAEHDGRAYAGDGCGNHNAHNGLPFGGTKGQGAFTQGVGH